MLLDPAINAP